MKQKRSKSELRELETNSEAKTSSTDNGGKSDLSRKLNASELACASGVCSVNWKPDSLKR